MLVLLLDTNLGGKMYKRMFSGTGGFLSSLLHAQLHKVHPVANMYSACPYLQAAENNFWNKYCKFFMKVISKRIYLYTFQLQLS